MIDMVRTRLSPWALIGVLGVRLNPWWWCEKPRVPTFPFALLRKPFLHSLITYTLSDIVRKVDTEYLPYVRTYGTIALLDCWIGRN
jgi:hypothetical protein